MQIQATANSAGTTDTTLSINCAIGDKALVVFIGGGNFTKPTSITFNGAALTKSKENDQTTRYSAVWTLFNPSPGTYNITLNQNGGYRFSAVALSGVDTVLGVINTDNAQGATTPASVTNNPVLAGDVVFASLGLRSTRSIAISAGNAIYDDDDKHGSAWIEAPNTSGTVTWNLGSDADWAIASIALRTAAFIPQIIFI